MAWAKLFEILWVLVTVTLCLKWSLLINIINKIMPSSFQIIFKITYLKLESMWRRIFFCVTRVLKYGPYLFSSVSDQVCPRIFKYSFPVNVYVYLLPAFSQTVVREFLLTPVIDHPYLPVRKVVRPVGFTVIHIFWCTRTRRNHQPFVSFFLTQIFIFLVHHHIRITTAINIQTTQLFLNVHSPQRSV